ncbi:MAG: HAD-IB family hydrolase [Cyclobacteriaceae bacterium]
MQKLAIFDFDGTITRRDTMLELIRYSKGSAAYYAGLLALAPWLVAYRMGLIPNWRAKEIMLARFFKGMPVNEFKRLCDNFSQEVVPRLTRPGALARIREFKQDKTRVVVLTASAEAWVKGWCEQQGLECLATRLEVRDQRITGRLAGPNCYGKEKVNRLRQHLALNDYQEIYAYGDTKGDREMLQLAHFAYYRAFCD